MRRICISIDLDPLSCYYDIHGIEAKNNIRSDLIYTRALERIFDFFLPLKIRPTLFVVGKELRDDTAVNYLKNAVQMGYEIANHSYSHLYNLSLLDRPKIEEEIRNCEGIIGEKLSFRSVGFRAPGYNVNRDLMSCVIDLGYKYDSSLLPSPFYYFAKCSVILFYKMIGRKTKSICGSIKMPFGKRTAYLTDEETIYRDSRNGKINEFPISVGGFVGIPFVGTFIMGYREIIYNYLKKVSVSLPFLHIELHGIDFIDSGDIQDERLLKSQFDLNVPLRVKLARLRSLIDEYNPEGSRRLCDLTL